MVDSAKQGWGAAGSAGVIESNVGAAKKSSAAAYWENKTEELDYLVLQI